MNYQKLQSYLWHLLLVAVLVQADVRTKYYMSKQISLEIFDWFNLHLAYNKGSAFSLQIPHVLTISLGILIIVLLLSLPLSKKLTSLINITGYPRLIIALITAGVIGNTIDRIAYGVVIDFIAIGGWPTFNLADIYLTSGAAIIILYEIKNYYLKKQKC